MSSHLKKRYSLLVLCLVIASLSVAQEKSFSVSLQSAYNISQSSSAEGSLLFGLITDEGGTAMAGFAFRRLTRDPGHSRDYISLRVYGGRQLVGGLGMHVQADLRRGTYYLYEAFRDNDAKARSATRLFGNLGLDYKMTSQVMLTASYVVQDYNPQKFVQKRLSPHKSGALKIGVNVMLTPVFSKTQ